MCIRDRYFSFWLSSLAPYLSFIATAQMRRATRPRTVYSGSMPLLKKNDRLDARSSMCMPRARYASTYVEAYLARGMHIDDLASNLSFFFRSGMDPEYTVLGRVARRIWAVAMKERYGANELSQKLKYHIQTSGRSLHAQEIQFNDIRTTLQALIA